MLEGYRTNRPSTVRQAEVHLKQIKAEFGDLRLSAVRPSHIKTWTSKLKAGGAADSYVYALHARLGQVLGDAVHDGILPRNPVSRRTSPAAGKQRPYVATTEQVWALYEAVPKHMQPAILLGAFVGLRTAEAVALRVDDVDFMRGVVRPTVQHGGVQLKTKLSQTPVPIPNELALLLSAAVADLPSSVGRIVTDATGERPDRGWLTGRYAVPVTPWRVCRRTSASTTSGTTWRPS